MGENKNENLTLFFDDCRNTRNCPNTGEGGPGESPFEEFTCLGMHSRLPAETGGKPIQKFQVIAPSGIISYCAR